MRVRALLGVGVICALQASAPARADSLTITASGTIQPSCSVAVQAAFQSADFTASGSSTAQALVNCNGGFRINVTSANGAAKTTNQASSGFTNALSYTLGLSVPLDDSSTASAICTSASLVAGQSTCALSPGNATGLSSGGKTAMGKVATLTASWVLPAQKLVAGSYSDTLTVSIASVP